MIDKRQGLWVNEVDGKSTYFFKTNRVKNSRYENFACYDTKTKLLMMVFNGSITYYPSTKQRAVKYQLSKAINPKRSMLQITIGSLKNGKQKYEFEYYAILDNRPAIEQMEQMEDILLQPVEDNNYRGQSLQEIKKQIQQEQNRAFKRQKRKQGKEKEHYNQ